MRVKNKIVCICVIFAMLLGMTGCVQSEVRINLPGEVYADDKYDISISTLYKKTEVDAAVETETDPVVLGFLKTIQECDTTLMHTAIYYKTLNDNGRYTIEELETAYPEIVFSEQSFCLDIKSYFSAIEEHYGVVPATISFTLRFAGEHQEDAITNMEYRGVENELYFDYNTETSTDRYIYYYGSESTNTLEGDIETLQERLEQYQPTLMVDNQVYEYVEEADISDVEIQDEEISDSIEDNDEADEEIDDEEVSDTDNEDEVTIQEEKESLDVVVSKWRYKIKPKASKKKARSAKINAYGLSMDSNNIKLSFKKISGYGKIKISKAGKIAAKKGYFKGAFRIKVMIYKNETSKYNAVSKKVTIRVIIA